jgi:hypothetical protein
MSTYVDGCGNNKQDYERQKILKQRIRIEVDSENRQDLSSSSEPMKCPKCGFLCSHLKHVTFLEDYENRRESVSLLFEGECGHDWEVIFRQHEGATFMWTSAARIRLRTDLIIGLRD